MPSTAPLLRQCPSLRGRSACEGVALVLVLVFTILLYVLITELVVTARMARLTGENDALLARMQNDMLYTLGQVEEQLKDDLDSASSGGGPGGGGLPGMSPGGGGALSGGALSGAPAATGASGASGGLAGLGGGLSGGGSGGLPGGLGGGPGGEQQDPAAVSDGSRDAWFEPTGYADDDLTTYVWVEDENRKFNILSLVSQDQEFADDARARFVRLIDHLREDSEFDLSTGDGEQFADEIIDWMEGNSRTDQLPRPDLESDQQTDGKVIIPFTLDELTLLPGIDDDLLYDKVLDGRVIPGLESALTIYTCLRVKPAPPDPNDPNATTTIPGVPSQEDPLAPPVIGEGIRINVNTASRAVLRSILPEYDMPDSVIDALLRYRNEQDETEELSAEGGAGSYEPGYYDDLELGTKVKKKVFTSPEDLDQVPEFANMANPDAKQKFLDAITTKSDVFSVHMACLYKRNEEQHNFVLRRTRSILVRLESGDGTTLYPIELMEERHGLRVQQVDFPVDYDASAYQTELNDMDRFAAEERRWNPFYVEFYVPRDDERR